MAQSKVHKQLLNKMVKDIISVLKKERGNMKAVKQFLHDYVLEMTCEAYQDEWWDFIQDTVESGYNVKPLKKMTVEELALEAVESCLTESLSNKNYYTQLQEIREMLTKGNDNDDDCYEDDDED